ncbi:MAG: precorrin-6A synthase (deacetylating) [Reyranella sp.]|uniref:precorrin-6A synthase (deacetylating) n=1 Tax=Reyranella sp. TaxID=1929291 RepID=UPI001ACCFBB3|nr:precorrin-6A synthase (deacetylating) [Reyranella sp.]MBN9089312.1 precorrin-6A synthase (deacetylating) [Reyranella sp.]
MKKLLIIGIGAGDPDFITLQAAKALATVDVFFMLEKGAAKDAMVELRREACRRHAGDRAYRVVEAPSPPRERRPADYASCVDDLNRAKQETFERMIADNLADGQVGAILAWGDPSLYDSTIRNVEAIAARLGLAWEVIPGISAVQVLAARHRIPLNTVAQPVEITTGRRLSEGWPAGVDSVVVMLDGEDTWRRFADQDIDIWWGAYLGTPDEILLSGHLKDVSDEIHRVRVAARERHGWIMDTYLMRRR